MNYKDYIKVTEALREAKDYIQYHDTGRNKKSKNEVLKIIRQALSPAVAEVSKELVEARKLKESLKIAKQKYFNSTYWAMTRSLKNNMTEQQKTDSIESVIDAYTSILYDLLKDVK